MSGKVIQTRAELVAALRQSVDRLQDELDARKASDARLDDQIAHTKRLLAMFEEVKK